MLGWVLALLVLALVLLALAAPVDLVVDASASERGARHDVRVRWLFVDHALRAKAGPGGEERAAPRKERKRLHVLAMLRTQGFVDACRRALQRMRRAIRVRALDLRVMLGLADPAETGFAMGMLAPLFAAVPLPPRARVVAQPDFERERLEGELHARLRLWPLLAVAAFVGLALTPATWRALRAGRRA